MAFGWFISQRLERARNTPRMKIKKLLVRIITVLVIYSAGVITGLYSVKDTVMRYSFDSTIEPSPKPTAVTYPTGVQVLAELNKYRREIGLPEFILSETLCNNIGERWQHYKDYNNHDGLEEFEKKWQWGTRLTEILASGETAVETVNGWRESPSHDIFIRNNSKICVYSAEGFSVALLSN